MPNSAYNRQRKYERKKSREAADIGDIPPVGNPSRRDSCRTDLFRFLTTYFPQSTGLSPFSEDHRRVIARIERCVLQGGLFVNAVYRGFAKTTISENAVIWAAVYGHRKFVPIFGAGADMADGNIDSIKLELSENDLLYEDFPEVCHPIRALEGKPQRCASQTYSTECTGCGGEAADDEVCPQCKGSGVISVRTHIVWSADEIVMPTIPGSLASGTVVRANGIGAASRGFKHKRPDGTQQRPDFVIVDDPQTNESAESPSQVNKRLGILKKSILKMGGHNRQLAVVLNATVIQPNDLIEQLLDPKRNPNWQGERIKMVTRWSNHHDTLWMGDYARIRNTYDPENIDDQKRAHKEATEFYRRNQAKMDEGCIVSWAHCYDHDAELSAIQHAHNALIDDGAEVFASECQNEPLQPHADSSLLTPAQIATKWNGLRRAIIPLNAEFLTAFTDVQGEILYWMVCAWGKDFTGAVVDYGSFPDQSSPYFTLANARKTLAKTFPGTALEGRIYAGLEKLTDQLADRVYAREDGAEMRLAKMPIDANWGKSTETVNTFCRRSKHAALLLPSHGKGLKASDLPWDQYTRREGERLGNHWRMPSLKGKASATRHVIIDVNYWKTFVHNRLAVPIGDKGSLSLFGMGHTGRPMEEHRLLADHLTSEYRIETEARGRKVDEWKIKPGKPDNHWFDCLVGCAAAASMLGCSLMAPVVRPVAARPRRRVSYMN